MNPTLKRLLFVLAVVILLPVALFIANEIHVAIRISHLQRADHARILSACREMLANRSSYRNDNLQWGYAYRYDVVILPPMPENLPPAIRELHPHHVIIHDDLVLIDLSLPLHKLGLLGFNPGAKQYGTLKYVDGLWFWNGIDAQP